MAWVVVDQSWQWLQVQSEHPRKSKTIRTMMIKMNNGMMTFLSWPG